MTTMEAEHPWAGLPLRRWVGGRYGPLLVAVVVLLVLSPILRREHVGSLGELLVYAIMLAGLIAVSRHRATMAFGWLLVLLALGSHLAVGAAQNRALSAAHYILVIALLTFSTATILLAIVRDARVTLETLKGAICVYVLMGLVGAYACAAIDILVPGSYNIEPGSEGRRRGHLLVQENLPELMYFSFATLTTLGYGDIIPRSSPARTVAYLEAVAGQLYLTVLIARLVGMHIARPVDDEAAPPP